ncbi:MAG: SUMF1/EgtB/PvdO family nonheme iron enzyme [Candidatus Pedobacter colombiensis]|uniref:SUMF1/EgtB/PvdO family nonheme iron enzyme n=1 Tax=Candidatus Pedobacter colombiensis TaxID=3121371 RepID=A0AAJ5W6K9_9SPHI|nr:SUMF1/EgtB/PvdO family nonheme iron enzyme [Pedobacter sp.]WEK18967.1 MAG: SUMF1/EgtB/PvdO family nonheme iron enzyme [Pedobacter sp.]
MRNLYFVAFIIIAGLFSSCGKGGQGELVGVYNRKFRNNKIPLGMVYIPPGRTLIGMSDEDINNSQGSPSRMTSFSAFFMDQTEISNAEYRQFVAWVRDSVAVTSLGPTVAPAYFKPAPKGANGAAALGANRDIDWKKVGNGSLLWSKKNGGMGNKLTDMYYSGADALPGKNEIDIRKLKYAYSYVSSDLAVEGRKDPSKKRQDFIITYTDNPDPSNPNHHPSVPVYPDTLVWKVDYSYSQNDPMVKTYFNHPSYDEYPVVGVTWEQASAFCVWRTRFYESVASARKLPANSRPEYQLPSDAQFEYAARGGNVKTKYPWGGPYVRNTKGCMQANFKVGRGNYSDDGGLYTVNVKSYFPNDYGLYNMAGNVAEWTITAYNQSAAPMLLDFNPNFTYVAKTGDSKYLKRKVVRGGSWKDIGFFLQNSVATYEYQDQARSYIGFRCISAYPGTDINYRN